MKSGEDERKAENIRNICILLLLHFFIFLYTTVRLSFIGIVLLASFQITSTSAYSNYIYTYHWRNATRYLHCFYCSNILFTLQTRPKDLKYASTNLPLASAP